MIDETGTEAARVGFCQDCGRPLTRETARVVGSGMFCEPCLATRLAAAAQGSVSGFPGATATSSTPPVDATGAVPPGSAWTTYGQAGFPGAGPGTTAPPGTMPRGTMPPFGGDSPNPVLAGFLGLIPGVGAMYNGQFGKGIAHLVIFFLLQSMDHVNGFFGFLAFLWCLYQAFEAYHTARARREGRPLPDPFGFNDIADRVGFTYFHGPAGSARPPATPPPTAAAGQPGFTAAPPAYDPTEPFVPVPAPVQPVAQGWASGSSQAPAPFPPLPTGYEPVQPSSGTSIPYAMPYVPTPYPQAAYVPVVAPVAPASGIARFPSVAVWLIGLGIVFLLLTIDSNRWSVEHTLPFLLGALAVWVFVRRMSATGGVMPIEQEDGLREDHYAARVTHNLTLPGMLLVLAVLMGLNNLRITGWDTTWPVLLIAFGGFLLLERLVRRPVLVAVPPYPGQSAATAEARKGEV